MIMMNNRHLRTINIIPILVPEVRQNFTVLFIPPDNSPWVITELFVFTHRCCLEKSVIQQSRIDQTLMIFIFIYIWFIQHFQLFKTKKKEYFYVLICFKSTHYAHTCRYYLLRGDLVMH